MWQYHVICVGLRVIEKAQAALNTLGREGFEVFSVVATDGAVIFTLRKRIEQ